MDSFTSLTQFCLGKVKTEVQVRVDFTSPEVLLLSFKNAIVKMKVGTIMASIAYID